MTAEEGMRIIEHRHLTAPEADELVHALFEKEDEARVYRSYYEKARGLRGKLTAATGQEVDSDVDSLGDLHGILHAEEEADAGKLREAEERIDKSLLSKVVGVIVNERLKVRRLSAEGLAKSILSVIFPDGTEDPPSSWPTNEAESAALATPKYPVELRCAELEELLRELGKALKALPATDGRVIGLIPFINRIDAALTPPAREEAVRAEPCPYYCEPSHVKGETCTCPCHALRAPEGDSHD